jgi:hypothetical protein
MKLLMSLTLLVSFSSMASGVHREFDEKLELKCHEELKVLGCINSQGMESEKCVEKNKKKVSPSCQALLDVRKFNP